MHGKKSGRKTQFASGGKTHGRDAWYRSAAVAAGLLCLLVVVPACSTWSHNSAKSDKSWAITKLWKKEYQQPTSIAVIWSPDTLTMTGKPPTRGFGGRIFFYNQASQAVPVDGELIVHGYRSQPFIGVSEQVHADKTFGFTAEQLTTHFSPSQLGASYSIWIPWDAADGFREEVTLIPTFKGTDGTIVQGAPAKLYLPGRSLELGAKSPPSGTAQTVSYQRATTPTNPGIELPKAARVDGGKSQPSSFSLPPSITPTSRPADAASAEALARQAAAVWNRQGLTLGGTPASMPLSPAAGDATPPAAGDSSMPTVPQASRQTPRGILLQQPAARLPQLPQVEMLQQPGATGHRGASAASTKLNDLLPPRGRASVTAATATQPTSEQAIAKQPSAVLSAFEPSAAAKGQASVQPASYGR
ncbi:MAG: hypothetical protein KDA45_05760 [Planctomycetales bacterium]|nr:hypothetical protein [Planctomycetales bacterium]